MRSHRLTLRELRSLRGVEIFANLPEVARQLLVIDGIRSIFLANDFITLMQESSADWQPILVEAARLIGLAEGEVAQMVADERACMIDEQELARIETAAYALGGGVAIANYSDEKQVNNRPSQQLLLAELGHTDWERRLKAIQKIEVNDETFPAVLAALDDERSAIRRWAAAILGGSGMPEAVEPLCRVVLSDSSVVVRRTAGDALSDLGDAQAIATMCQALEDRSKLVRWRAARFLNEVGDETAVEPLRRAAERESEFDVRVEILAATERIEGGGEAQMPMWMRIAKGVE